MRNKGITLVALVITIIVLLILSGVTISALSGENGIITNAIKAKEQINESNFEENVNLVLSELKLNKNKNVQKFLEGKFEIVEPLIDEKIFKVREGLNEKIISSEGNIVEVASINENYVGFYADFDGTDGQPDGKPDGIIFADLAKEQIGEWGNNGKGNFKITADKEKNFKKYYISNENYRESGITNKDGKIKGKILSILDKGQNKQDRFYIMDLEDLREKEDEKSRSYPGSHFWYKNAEGKMSNYKTDTSTNFGTGKANTNNMINIWSKNVYGDSISILNNEYKMDMWGLSQLKSKVEKGWFIPSKEEWCVFAENLGINLKNYTEYKLNNWYWSSSQDNLQNAWLTSFVDGCIKEYHVGDFNYVRLATTF